MSMTAESTIRENNAITSAQLLFRDMLLEGGITALLVAQHLPMKNTVMPTLITDPDELRAVDPFAPCYSMNTAKVVSKLTRKSLESPIAVVLRPCEIRAFVELVKLKQGCMDNLLVVGTECLGAYGNRDYPIFAGSEPMAATLRFYEKAQGGKTATVNGLETAPACKACEHPVPENADLVIGVIGADMNGPASVTAKTEKGKALLEKIGREQSAQSAGREAALAKLMEERIAYRDKMFAETVEATSDLEKLMSYLGNCINCYNCRVACPVCYCRECVFTTDVFDHEPAQYLRWAKKKGVLKMPTDTVFYHITRMAHMSLACVGCGQCSNACPNGIHVMELLRTVAHETQREFGYEAGRSISEEPPLSTFKENEFPEVTARAH